MTSNIHNIYKYNLSINAPIFTCHSYAVPNRQEVISEKLSQDILNVKAIGSEIYNALR